MGESITPARLAYLTGNAYGAGRQDCITANGDRATRISRRIDLPTEMAPAYDPWHSRSYPDHATALSEAYERGWQDGERDLKKPDPGWA